MVEFLTDIPLPGRMLTMSNVPAGSSGVRKPLSAFVAGPENRLVAGAISALMQSTSCATEAQQLNRLKPPVLVLFGPSGTGKTHLARGLVRYWQEHRGPESAEYIPAADFRHRLNDAVKRQAELEFRRAVRSHQLLAIDDLHHLPADDYTWHEMRNTLDDYRERGATVIVTSTEPIAAIPSVPLDIRGRLACGLTLQLAPPGSAARTRLIRHASQALGRPLSEDTADRLASGLSGTVNTIFGAVFELCSAANQRGTTDSSRADQLLAARADRRPTLREIVAAVARHQSVTQVQLKSASRRQSIVFARAIAIFLARELAVASYEQIGRALGNRDHTTIIHSYRKIVSQNERDPQTQRTLEQLRHILLSR
jgi:chromosomal replication initiator protein